MGSFIKFIFTWIKYLFTWKGFWILLFVLGIFFFFGHFFSEPFEKNITILFADSTLEVSQKNLSAHNANLISTLRERESMYISSIVSQVSAIMQNRVIYIALIGVILTLFFSKYEKKNNSFIYIILLVLFILFYGLDVHQEDLLTRREKTKEITSNTLDYLVNLKPTDTSWYYIDYTKRNSMFFEKNSEFCTRIPRKIRSAYHPNVVQWIYYILPWFSIYFWRFFIFRYREKVNRPVSQNTLTKNSVL
jgi:hypothetical protein